MSCRRLSYPGIAFSEAVAAQASIIRTGFKATVMTFAWALRITWTADAAVLSSADVTTISYKSPCGLLLPGTRLLLPWSSFQPFSLLLQSQVLRLLRQPGQFPAWEPSEKSLQPSSSYATPSLKTGTVHPQVHPSFALQLFHNRHAARHLAKRCERLRSALKQYEKRPLPDRIVQYWTDMVELVVEHPLTSWISLMTCTEVSSRSRIGCKNGQGEVGPTC